ncbi:MAG: HAD family hydrolase [Pseudomonadota bacterium]
MPSLARPKAIFIDLDDTMISAYAKVHEHWTEVLEAQQHHLEGHGIETVRESIIEATRHFWSDPDRHRTGRLRIEETIKDIIADGLARIGLERPKLARHLRDEFESHRWDRMHLFPGVHETLDSIKASGIGLAVVTNGPARSQRPKLERFDLEHRFDHVLIEGEFGVGKPDPKVYQHLLATFGADPSEAWMVGDHLEWEVAAPQRHGITGIWCNVHGHDVPDSHAHVEPDHVIDGLQELIDLLA